MNLVVKNLGGKFLHYLLIFIYGDATLISLVLGSYIWSFLWFLCLLITLLKVQDWFLKRYEAFLVRKHFTFFRCIVLFAGLFTLLSNGHHPTDKVSTELREEYSLKKESLITNLQNSSWEIKKQAVLEGAKYQKLADAEFLKIYQKSNEELASNEKQVKLKDFYDQKDKIRSEIKNLIKEMKYQEAQNHIQSYKDIAGNEFNDLEKVISDELKKVAENKRLQERLNDPKKLEYMAVIDSYLYEMKNAKISDIKQSPDIDITLFKIKSYGNIYHEASLYEFTPAENKIIQDYKVQVIAFQKKAFPRMREIYGRFVDQRGWEFDIDGKSFGDGFRKIEFIGYL